MGYPLNNAGSRAPIRNHLRFLTFLSRSRRSAVRFFAAAVAAIFARAERSSGVMVSRLRLPPLEPIAAIACRIRSRVSFAAPYFRGDLLIALICRGCAPYANAGEQRT